MKLIKSVVMVSVLLITLNGCAGGYQLPSESKSVFVDKISPNSITVTFCGNAYMSQNEVEKYALQRASVEALSRGCSHFIVVKKDDKSKVCSISSAMNKKHVFNAPPIKNSGYLTSSEFVEPNITLIIECVPKGQAIPEGAIEAEKFLDENFPGMNK